MSRRALVRGPAGTGEVRRDRGGAVLVRLRELRIGDDRNRAPARRLGPRGQHSGYMPTDPEEVARLAPPHPCGSHYEAPLRTELERIAARHRPALRFLTDPDDYLRPGRLTFRI